MISTVIAVYLIGWLPVSFAVYTAGKRLAEPRRAADDRLMVIVSLAAGVVWPLLVVGLVELSSIVMLTRRPAASQDKVGILA